MCGSEVTGQGLRGLFTTWLKFSCASAVVPQWIRRDYFHSVLHVNIKLREGDRERKKERVSRYERVRMRDVCARK